VGPGGQGRLPARASRRTAAFILLHTRRIFSLQRHGLLPVASFTWANVRALAAGWWRRRQASNPVTSSQCCAPQAPACAASFGQAKSGCTAPPRCACCRAILCCADRAASKHVQVRRAGREQHGQRVGAEAAGALGGAGRDVARHRRGHARPQSRATHVCTQTVTRSPTCPPVAQRRACFCTCRHGHTCERYRLWKKNTVGSTWAPRLSLSHKQPPGCRRRPSRATGPGRLTRPGGCADGAQAGARCAAPAASQSAAAAAQSRPARRARSRRRPPPRRARAARPVGAPRAARRRSRPPPAARPTPRARRRAPRTTPPRAC